jgi:predicted transcriptional regulator
MRNLRGAIERQCEILYLLSSNPSKMFSTYQILHRCNLSGRDVLRLAASLVSKGLVLSINVKQDKKGWRSLGAWRHQYKITERGLQVARAYYFVKFNLVDDKQTVHPEKYLVRRW